MYSAFPPSRVIPSPSDWVLAVDVGGTKVASALIDATGTIDPDTRHREPTGAHASKDALAAAVRSTIARTIASAPGRTLLAAGIGCAGPVNVAAGTVSPLNLPAWRDFALRDLVAEASGAPASLRLDGLCIALAELRTGALKGADTGMAMVVSTGIGGGIVADGRLLGGATGNAGHIGQVGVADGNGRYATLESIASGPHIVAWARQQGWNGATGEELGDAYADGDPIAKAAVSRCTRAVAEGIASTAALLDLEVVAIGGGFANVAENFPALVAGHFAEIVPLPTLRGLRIVRAELGGDAPLLGAGAVAQDGALLPD